MNTTLATLKGDHILFHVNDEIGRSFYWLSTALAVLTALLQGLVTALASMTESTSQWTFRFRISRVEHWWWTFITILLLTSLIMVILSFVSGNGGDAISVLALSSATFLAIVRHTIPAWHHRHYIEIRWLAWSGASRTAVGKRRQKFCGDSQSWNRLVRSNISELSKLRPTPSDYYGWRIWPASGISYNPADILSIVDDNGYSSIDTEKSRETVSVYVNHDEQLANVSLLWGPHLGFQKVISRAIASMPLNLLQSDPITVEGYDGKALTIAMGILGRNKGLQPWKLVFSLDSGLSSILENTSTWRPRPAKVLRSFYKASLSAQYSGLGDQFTNAAVELALTMADTPYWAAEKWLSAMLEHQDLQTNIILGNTLLASSTSEERHAALCANYESSYVSMVISLNYMPPLMKARSEIRSVTLCRPDILCTGILLKARGYPVPRWWNDTQVCKMRQGEIQRLSAESDWRLPMAKLLGLDRWPDGFEKADSTW